MVMKDPFVSLETLYLHSPVTWPHDCHLTYFSRHEPAGSSVSCSSLDALRVTGKQWSFYKNKGLARMCPGVAISFSCPSISQSGNRRPIARDAGSAGGSAWEDRGYLCAGVCPCWVFPAVQLQVSEATDLGAFISLKPAFNNNTSGHLRTCSPTSGALTNGSSWFCLVRSAGASWAISPPCSSPGGKTKHRLLE